MRRAALANDFGPASSIRRSGFIAQEVEKVAKEIGYDFDGIHKPENDHDNYALAYSQFVVPLVKAVQEQQVEIEKQEAINKDLQQQVSELKALVNGLVSGDALGKKAATGNTTLNLSDKNTLVLNQNVPNPFAESTLISYNIPDGFQKAQIIFSTVDGKVIKTHGITEKGKGVVNVFADDLTSGTYTYTLIVDGKNVDSKKMIKQ